MTRGGDTGERCGVTDRAAAGLAGSRKYWWDGRMNADILKKIAGIAADNGLDAIVAASPENFAYLAGFVVPSHHVLRWRHAMLTVKPDETVAAFTVDMEESTVAGRLPGVPLKSWGEFTDSSMVVFAEQLRELSLTRGRVGLETDYLPARDMEILERELPGIEFVAVQNLFNRARMIKTDRERDLLQRLSRISDQSIGDALAAADVGASEMQIAADLTRGIYSRGAEDFKFMIIATGERSQLPNVGPSERILAAGDVCRVEIFSILNGYHAGVCRSAYVGAPPDEAERIWSLLSDATQMLLETIRPGASTRDIYDSYLKMIAPLNMPPIAFVGHGIGLHLHEDPYLGAQGDCELEAGMVLGIEPLIYRTGFGFGLQNKDMVAVTGAGCTLLSDSTATKFLVKCGQATA
jgi:Xaa-Pro aminopeptidase